MTAASFTFAGGPEYSQFRQITAQFFFILSTPAGSYPQKGHDNKTVESDFASLNCSPQRYPYKSNLALNAFVSAYPIFISSRSVLAGSPWLFLLWLAPESSGPSTYKSKCGHLSVTLRPPK
jgi:hypothetical protein